MNEDLFPGLDEALQSGDAAAGLRFLIERFLATEQYGSVFETRLMAKRLDLGLPLVQTEPVESEEYQAAMTAAAREAGSLFLAAGNIERAWPYFRAISETAAVAEAIARIEPREDLEGVISIAFQEGLLPAKGLELILAQHGMCRAITAFGMTSVTKDREKCIALLARSLHAEIVERMGRAIEAREGSLPCEASLAALMAGRDWLFGEWDYYVDTSHLLSVIPYSVEISGREVLQVFAALCEYGGRLAPQFQSPGVAPFENQCEAYGHYVQALLGNDVEEHVGYFRKQTVDCDPEIAGDAPARALVRLLVALGREKEALDVLLEHVFEDAPYGAPVPSALSLCYRTKDFARMKEIARERGDLLSYAAGSILSRSILSR